MDQKIIQLIRDQIVHHKAQIESHNKKLNQLVNMLYIYMEEFESSAGNQDEFAFLRSSRSQFTNERFREKRAGVGYVQKLNLPDEILQLQACGILDKWFTTSELRYSLEWVDSDFFHRFTPVELSQNLSLLVREGMLVSVSSKTKYNRNLFSNRPELLEFDENGTLKPISDSVPEKHRNDFVTNIYQVKNNINTQIKNLTINNLQ